VFFWNYQVFDGSDHPQDRTLQDATDEGFCPNFSRMEAANTIGNYLFIYLNDF
jgi:hypothetical protein